MLWNKPEAWVPVRKTNLKYFDDIELYYKNPYGRIVLYKPKGMRFSDQSLQTKPHLGDLFVKPEDKVACLRAAQQGFGMELTDSILNEGPQRVKEELISIVDETLANPRGGGLEKVPTMVGGIVDGYSRQPDVIKHLARISHTDYTTTVHSINVMALTVGYCFYTSRSFEKTKELGLAALLHDVGKIEIPAEILVSTKKLTPDEFAVMRTHPEKGADILKENKNGLAAAIPGVMEHHERLDASGYPKGTIAISEAGQVLAIVDCYEAITNDERPYRRALRPLAALEILKDEVDDGRFNRKVFEDFAYSLTEFASDSEWRDSAKLFKGWEARRNRSRETA